MNDSKEIRDLFSQMAPCGQDLLVEVARKYVARWPVKSSLRLAHSSIQPTLHDINNVIDSPAPVLVRKAINGK